ncbi:hypothetical protein KTH15_13425 [Acinetobacter pittii]|uniref:hypothetical protein n=1 Tax=Acinetobacter pittii TaxID=48296 RepID=UPI0021CDDAAA|nr:hypothetical protein [Acinetobacter pittii]MCU4341758.1 hypothetical protein [Acinetobacter pittii]
MLQNNYLNPIISAILKTNIILKGRACGRTTLNFFGLCSTRLPMLQWDYSKDFCFNPKKIKKISDRKLRKACYQAFAQYKNSFKPQPIQKLKILKDEWQTTITKMAKTANKQFSDMADAMSYAFLSLKNFKANYMCAWDLAE